MSNITHDNKVIKDTLNLTVIDNDINKEGKYNGYYISGEDEVKILYSNSIARRLVIAKVRGHYYETQELKRSEARAIDFKQSLLKKDCEDINLQRADDNLKGIQQALSIMIAEIPVYDEALAFFSQKADAPTYQSIVNALRNRARNNNIRKAVTRDYKPLTKAQLNKISIDDEPVRMPFGDNEMESDVASDINSHTSTVLNGKANPNTEVQTSEVIS